MAILFYALISVFVFSFTVFVVLFGPSPTFRDTPVGLANRLLRREVPRICHAADDTLTGGRVGNGCRYVFSERTPLVMIVYFVLMTGGILMFFCTTWKQIPGPAVSSIHWWIVLSVVPTPYVALYVLAKSDPGIITPQNHQSHLQLFPYDHIIYNPGVTCRTCRFVKPPRSKHCRVCNACIARHDHHCIWIGNCVGHSNTHLFLLFLVVNTLLLAYSSYLHFLIFSHRVAQIRLLQRQTIENLGAALHSYRLRPTYQLFSSVVLDGHMSGALFLICTMISLVTAAFTLHHLWLLSTGTTTNESFKWADIKDSLEYREIVILDRDDPLMYTLPPSSNDVLLNLVREYRVSRVVPLLPPEDEDGEGDSETAEEEKMRVELATETERGARDWKDVLNIYASDSRWENIMQAIRGGPVSPAWERPGRKWFKRKD